VSPSRNDDPDRGPADEGPWLEPGEAEPGLLLFAPLGPGGLGPELEAVLAAGGIAAVVGDPGPLPAGERTKALAAAREACHRHTLAFLVRNDAAAARACGADGVHLDDSARVAAARGQLGAERVIGASCGRSRHAAMVAGEAGADYVMVGDPDRPVEDEDEFLAFAAWWNELFVIPCAVAGPLTPEQAAAVVRAGADLVGVGAGGVDLPGLAAALRALPHPEAPP
jgi:thiamine-phosphate pyrophosphorylase